MSDIDFQNGFILGLTLAFKKQAEGAGFGNYMFKNVSDTVEIVPTLTVDDYYSINLMPQVDNGGGDSIPITTISAYDDVTIILI